MKSVSLGAGRTGLALVAAAASLMVMAGSAVAISPAPAKLPFATHQAVYDLRLDSGGKAESVSDAEGRMVYDFAGSRCDGYTTKLRFVTRISDGDGNSRLTDVATSTFEDADGKSFSFATKSYVDGTLAEDSTGSAEREGGKLHVTLAKPKTERFDIAPSFQFPNQHLSTIIEAAMRGERFVQVGLFDGSEKGEKPYATAAVIGAANSGADDLGDEAAAKLAGIANVRHWPVTLSYFDQKGSGEQSPAYELSFIVYENGVTRRMRLDYGDFALTGKLVRLDMKPVKIAAKRCR
ncbi:cell envelope integrity EipB family protein [Kaistia sp. UC242_56]|uniref:cell envelope integrity EipB family protein n=1 Tax=Kaistia sp. UC242_56 TaxID=3374625 RepID=UPI0037A63EAD